MFLIQNIFLHLPIYFVRINTDLKRLLLLFKAIKLTVLNHIIKFYSQIYLNQQFEKKKLSIQFTVSYSTRICLKNIRWLINLNNNKHIIYNTHTPLIITIPIILDPLVRKYCKGGSSTEGESSTEERKTRRKEHIIYTSTKFYQPCLQSLVGINIRFST